MSPVQQRKKPAVRAFQGRLVGMPHDEEAPASLASTSVVVPTAVEPAPKKMGRPPKGDSAMTAAERKAASRRNQKSTAEDVERRTLIARLMKIFRRQESSVFETDYGESVIKRRAQRNAERIQYEAEIDGLSLEELRIALEGKSTPDSHGRLELETKSGGLSNEKVLNMREAGLRGQGGKVTVESKEAGLYGEDSGARYATASKPDGVGPDDKANERKTAPKPFDTRAFDKQIEVSATFDVLVAHYFESGRCVICYQFEGKSSDKAFRSTSNADQVEHLRAEYRAGEKLVEKIDRLSDPDIVDMAEPILIGVRKARNANKHWYVVSEWLRRGFGRVL